MQKFTLILLLLITLIGCEAQPESQNQSEQVSDKEVVCFVYHRFGDSRYPSTNVSLKDFESHLKYLKANEYQVMSFSQAIEYLQSDRTTQKTAVITIDDGYKSFYENGLPLLKKYGFPATLFVNTQTIGGGDYMGWTAIKDAKANDIEIGNHTHSHSYFLNQSEESRYNTFEEEIKRTQKLIEKHTGSAPEVFAYPYGELDLKMKAIVRNSGFKAAAAQNSGVIYHGTDLMQCPRFPMSEYYSAPDKFAGKAQMKALVVTNQNPESFILPTSKPKLTLAFEKDNLRLNELQCFIQGNECETSRTTNEDGKVMLSISPKLAIDQRRRTLYTVTVPDEDGRWHWYSHLWVNPSIE